MKKSNLLNILLLISSFLLCFILTEITWRILIFSSADIFKSQKKAFLYADSGSDDEYWKLHSYWVAKKEYAEHIKSKGPVKPDPKNKYFTRWIIRDTYEHVNSEYINNRRPVLLYGDSFSACYSHDDCFNHILNNDQSFSKKHFLLNYGVGGFGLDQIYLLLKNSIDNYNNPLVIVGLMTLDLDRSILSYRESPKPYFTIENDRLKLHEAPVYSDLDAMYADNKPQIFSYVYRRAIYSNVMNKLLPRKFVSYLKNEEFNKNKKIRINSKIIREIIKELKARNVDFIFLIFHPGWIHDTGSLNENNSGWRSSLICNILDENNIPYILSKDIIFQNIKAENRSVSDYYVENDGHPNGYQRKLIAQKIKEIILNTDLLIRTSNK